MWLPSPWQVFKLPRGREPVAKQYVRIDKPEYLWHVITKDKITRKRDLLKANRKSIASIVTIPTDILIYNQKEVQQRANLDTTLEHKISSQGVSVYGQ